jgi:hypothetical protein
MHLSKQITNLLAGTAGILTLVSCGGAHLELPSLEASPADLKDKAVIVLAVQLSDHFDTTGCIPVLNDIRYAPPSGTHDFFPRRKGDKIDADIARVGGVVVPGTYGISYAYCSDPVKKRAIELTLPPGKFFASIDVKAGEVVDAGTIHIHERQAGGNLITGYKYEPIVFVDAEPSHKRTSVLPAELQTKVIARLMTSAFPADPATLKKICDEEKQQRIASLAIARLIEGESQPPICQRVSDKGSAH